MVVGGVVGGLTSQVQGAVGGLTSQVQGRVGGLGAGIVGIVGAGTETLIGAVSVGAVGAATAKLTSVLKGMPKPNIPRPPSIPRIKTIKIPRPSDVKAAHERTGQIIGRAQAAREAAEAAREADRQMYKVHKYY